MKISEHDLKRSQFSYFLGKLVLVQTNHAAVQYDSSKESTLLHFNTYGGVCEGFDEYGVWLLNKEFGVKSFYFYKDIQGFVECPALSEDHPMVKEALSRVYKEEVVKKGKEITESLGDMSIEAFQKMIQEQVKR